MDVPQWGLVLALIGNGAALVWGASKMNSAIDTLGKAVDKLESSTDRMDTTVSDIEARVRVLEVVNEIAKRRSRGV
jgi:Sec-independent protein translocase protein TatA